MSPQSLVIIIVEKSGDLKLLNVKDYKEDELFKKCGFKKADGFAKHVDWPVKIDGKRYTISMYGKLDGKANTENKYDFPPPVDTKLFFGACVLVGYVKDSNNEKKLCNMTLDLWNKIYEKLFGGFENLALTIVEDEEEEDELLAIPASKKTKKGGYLKDGFVVDTDDDENENSDNESEDGSDDFDDSEETSDQDAKEYSSILEDIGSELSEEAYDYSTEESSDPQTK
jgi:hypothetical protein